MAEDGERTVVDDAGSQDEKEDTRNDGNYFHYFHRLQGFSPCFFAHKTVQLFL